MENKKVQQNNLILPNLVVMGDPEKDLRCRDRLLPQTCKRIASMRYLPDGIFIDLTGSEVIIGKSVEINPGVRILTHTHVFNKTNWRDIGTMAATRPTVIDDYAFIGINAIITPKCKHIGKHSVIGAGAVVTKNVPDNKIYGGNPAREIGDVT